MIEEKSLELEALELQAKSINKILAQNMEKLNDKNVKNKLAYLLWSGDMEIENYMKQINIIYKIVDRSITVNNYKRALRYTCLLEKYVKNIISLVYNKL